MKVKQFASQEWREARFYFLTHLLHFKVYFVVFWCMLHFICNMDSMPLFGVVAFSDLIIYTVHVGAVGASDIQHFV